MSRLHSFNCASVGVFFLFFGWRHLLRSSPFYADCHSLCSGTTNGRACCKLFPRRISVVGIAPPWGISFSRSTQCGSESVSASLSFNCKQSLPHSSFHLVILVGMRVSGKETHFVFCLFVWLVSGDVRIIFVCRLGQVDVEVLKGSGPFLVLHFCLFGLLRWRIASSVISALAFPIHKISHI